jgi:cytochrome c553
MMVRNQGPLQLDHPWSRIGWASFGAIVCISSLFGFVLLSRYQENSDPLTIWGAICRGLGITADTSAAASPQPPLRTPTDLAWTEATLGQIRAGDAQRGGFVAMNCSACHEEPAANPSHLIPTLDGMDAGVIFKQLADYRSGKRSWGVMNGIAKALTVQDSANVAVYFSSRSGGLQADSGMRVPHGGRGFREKQYRHTISVCWRPTARDCSLRSLSRPRRL